MSGSLSSVEGELNAVIKEYLEYSKLRRTLAAFEEECQKLGKPIQEQAGGSRKDERIQKIKNELLDHFDNGRRTEFFSEWETHLNPEVRESSLFCQKLEFRLQIHFAVLPMRKVDHWCKEEVEEAMLHFHYYLESRGSALSDCSELLPYYALPYVPRPSTHPTFAQLFQESWVPNLRKKLDVFLFEGLKSKDDAAQEPRLIELYHNRDLDLQDARKELQYLERHIEESEKRSVLHAKKCEKLQEECRQLMAVASLLVTALENAVKGNLVDMDCVLSACTTHLPDLDRLRSESPGFLSAKQHLTAKSMQVSEKLDLTKLKQDLRNSDERKKALLLQALRWRLTKAGNWHKREAAILEFVNGDLLDCQSTTNDLVVIQQFINSKNSLLLESFTRFLNAFSSFVLGRQYLTSNPKLLKILVEFLLSDERKEEPIVLDMILGTLKKLSIRRSSQALLVESGIVEWLAPLKTSKMSDYGLHSSVTLLFNLSLCPAGKKRCEPLKVELISGLGKLLQLQDSKISPYVNGILYRILSIPSVREYAKDQSLPSALKKVMAKTEGEPKKQLETILELFVTDVQIEDGSSDEEDEDQENDNLEPEIDADDKVSSESTELNGERLLEAYYENQQTGQAQSNPFLSHSKGVSEGTALGSIEEVHSADTTSDNPSAKLSSSSLHSELPVTPKLDMEATQLVRKIVGSPQTPLVEAAAVPESVTIKGFNSRPKIPRTPEPTDSPHMRRRRSSPLRAMMVQCNN
ncbi:hypothetical protein JTE90_011082 [Oedothorax gibbosus]|uniref:LisH domain-containing protein ARMC9 n=1 Tax=Oedothorax gibbosus TaxID=931172 RepID=A0AAV6UKH7_9ARAC|nr:hypothetical protein JTE90_011082 [Oedothorax gibbosus]